jgi:hypothetical protein
MKNRSKIKRKAPARDTRAAYLLLTHDESLRSGFFAYSPGKLFSTGAPKR